MKFFPIKHFYWTRWHCSIHHHTLSKLFPETPRDFYLQKLWIFRVTSPPWWLFVEMLKPCKAAGSLRFQVRILADPSWKPPSESFCAAKFQFASNEEIEAVVLSCSLVVTKKRSYSKLVNDGVCSVNAAVAVVLSKPRPHFVVKADQRKAPKTCPYSWLASATVYWNTIALRLTTWWWRVSCVTPCTNRKPHASDWLRQRKVLYNHQDRVFFPSCFFQGSLHFPNIFLWLIPKWTRKLNPTDFWNILSGIQVRNAIDRNGFCVPKQLFHSSHIWRR